MRNGFNIAIRWNDCAHTAIKVASQDESVHVNKTNIFISLILRSYVCECTHIMVRLSGQPMIHSFQPTADKLTQFEHCLVFTYRPNEYNDLHISGGCGKRRVCYSHGGRQFDINCDAARERAAFRHIASFISVFLSVRCFLDFNVHQDSLGNPHNSL